MTYRTEPIHVADSPSQVCPVANVDGMFPRMHPSAASVLHLGVAALGLGPLTGIPAILLARLVLRETAESNGLYIGESGANTGRVLGWVGSLIWSSLVLYWAASASMVAGLTAVALGCVAASATVTGRLWEGATPPLRRLGTMPIGASWPLWTAMAAAVVAGNAGLHRKMLADERLRLEAATTCATEVPRADAAVLASRFDEARARLGVARGACVGPELARVVHMDAELPGKEAEHRQRLEREEAERRARLAAERDRQAAAKFDERAKGIVERLDAAEGKSSQRRWLEARDDLDRVGTDLDEFKGTKVTTVERWLGFKARLDAFKQRIAPDAAKAEKVRAAEEEAKRKREEAQERAREAVEAAREARLRVRCCDGSLSRSCLCSSVSNRGCCSHHGGICGCED